MIHFQQYPVASVDALSNNESETLASICLCIDRVTTTTKTKKLKKLWPCKLKCNFIENLGTVTKALTNPILKNTDSSRTRCGLLKNHQDFR